MGLISKMLEKIKRKLVDTSGLGELVDTRNQFEARPTYKIEKPGKIEFLEEIDARKYEGVCQIARPEDKLH